MSEIRIAILSDLHVGLFARGKDFCPHPNPTGIEEEYLDSFLKFLKNQKLTADYLVLPGDVTESANTDEFKLASQILTKIMAQLAVSSKCTFFVPGNHDADWDVMKLPGEVEMRRKQRYDPLNQPQYLFHELLANGSFNLTSEPFFSTWETDQIFVLGYNSSLDDSPSVATHHGLVASQGLDQIERELALKSDQMAKKDLRIFVVHHHPVLWTNPIPNEADFSCMTNSESLVKLLQRFHFDIFVHGHRHAPGFRVEIPNAAFPIAVLSAGSFSKDTHRDWRGVVGNLFHLITVEGRDPIDGCAFGYVDSWAYKPGGRWLPSTKYSGLFARIPFGTYFFPDNLKRIVGPIIRDGLKQASYLEWSSIVAVDRRLNYLTPDRVSEVLESLRDEMHFKIHGAPGEGDVLLLREEVNDGKK